MWPMLPINDVAPALSTILVFVRAHQHTGINQLGLFVHYPKLFHKSTNPNALLFFLALYVASLLCDKAFCNISIAALL